MSVTISAQFDCSQREVVFDIAKIIYATHDARLPADLMYLYESQHPTERAVLVAAEAIFELLTGDSPSYDDDPDEDEDTSLSDALCAVFAGPVENEGGDRP